MGGGHASEPCCAGHMYNTGATPPLVAPVECTVVLQWEAASVLHMWHLIEPRRGKEEGTGWGYWDAAHGMVRSCSGSMSRFRCPGRYIGWLTPSGPCGLRREQGDRR